MNLHASTRLLPGILLSAIFLPQISAEEPVPARPLRDLNTAYFPFTPVKDAASWPARAADIKQRTLVAAGLWPMPEKTPLNAVIHGRVDRDDYTVDRVFFESLPGHFVTGSLYLPKNPAGKIPGILCPHGHWPNGRFMEAADKSVKQQLATGAERFENGARSPLQARCVQLARMGCAVFLYDMVGYADSVQFPEHRHGPTAQAFVSPVAESHLVSYLGLQTWNSIRAVDFMLTLPGIDPARIGCTGASGGGTQTMMLSGVDERVTASFPCVMVSTAMQGGCTCENASHLRIQQGNIDLAALSAPRPLGMTSADDWTKELETKGFPDLKQLYTMVGKPDSVQAAYLTHFPHNYNHVSRTAMYGFFNKHFKLGFEGPVLDRDFTLLSQSEAAVWDDKHPRPSGDQVGEAHELKVIAWFREQAEKKIKPLPRDMLLPAWQVLIGRHLPVKGDVSFDLVMKGDKEGHLILKGIAQYQVAERVDCTFIYPKTWNHKVILWLSLQGQEALLTASNDLSAAAQKMINEGYALVCPNLYLQGATRNPNVYARRKLQTYEGYAGYQYGYNPSLFAERVRDALTVIALVRDHESYDTQKILIAGVEGAGPIAAAAAALASSAVGGTVIAPEGFRFASLTDVWDVNFIPGGAKYGDLEGLVSLCPPGSVKVLDKTGEAAVEAVTDALVTGF